MQVTTNRRGVTKSGEILETDHNRRRVKLYVHNGSRTRQDTAWYDYTELTMGSEVNITTRTPTRGTTHKPITKVRHLTDCIATQEGKTWIMERCENKDARVVGCSDGSVYDHKYAGGYAWDLVRQRNVQGT